MSNFEQELEDRIMSAAIKDDIYHGCNIHSITEFNSMCQHCNERARQVMVNHLVRLEARVALIEKKWEERLNGNIDTEYNRYSVRGEIGTLADLISPRIDPTSVIKSGSDATPATGNRGTGEREDSVGRRRRRQIFDGSGILHEEGGNQ